jgi:hypothetical protein
LAKRLAYVFGAGDLLKKDAAMDGEVATKPAGTRRADVVSQGARTVSENRETDVR